MSSNKNQLEISVAAVWIENQTTRKFTAKPFRLTKSSSAIVEQT